jgi:carboxylesterase
MHEPIWREREGAESLIVFIHGFMGSPNQFNVLNLLEGAYEHGCSVYAILLPGHGGTSKNFACYGLADWENHLQNELSKHAGPYKKIILAGHSMGGLLAINASLQKQNQICGLFLLSSPLKLKLGLPGFRIRRRLRKYPVSHPIRSAYRQAKSLTDFVVSPLWLKPALDVIRLERKTKRNLPHVSAPVLAVHSRNDEMVSFQSAAMFYNGLCKSTRKRLTLEKSWHAYFPLEEQEQIRLAFLDFIDDCLNNDKGE